MNSPVYTTEGQRRLPVLSPCSASCETTCLFAEAPSCSRVPFLSCLSRADRTTALLSSVTLFVDTCSLIRPEFDLFLQRYESKLVAHGIKGTLLAQTLFELQNLAFHAEEEETRTRAESLLQLIYSERGRKLFTMYRHDASHCTADEALCRYVLEHYRHEHIGVVTFDSQLSSDIINISSTQPRGQYVTYVLHLTPTGELTRRRVSTLPGLAPTVELPACDELFSAAAVPAAAEESPTAYVFRPPFRAKGYRYLKAAIGEGHVVVCRDVLSRLVEPGQGGLEFLNHLLELHRCKTSIVLHVAEQLPDELRARLEPWAELFNFAPAADSSTSLADAVLAALYFRRDLRKGFCHHLTLLTEDTELYRVVAARAPRSFSTRELWCVRPGEDGWLERIVARRPDASADAAETASSSSIAA